jgi:outer membrane protein TolC
MLGGCAMFASAPDPSQRQSKVAAPDAWRQTSSGVIGADAGDLAQWWRRLGDERLNNLIERGLASALDIRSAQARLRQARASRELAAAGWFPNVGFSTDGTRTSYNDRMKRAAQKAANTKEVYNANFDASWEPDIFGVTRHAVSGAEADIAAETAKVEYAKVTLAAEIALNYMQYRASQDRLAIACRNALSQEETLNLTRWRATAGKATQLAVAQARTSLEQALATIPALRNAQAASLNRLDILLGQAPGALAENDRKEMNAASTTTLGPDSLPGIDLKRFFEPGNPAPCSVFDAYPEAYAHGLAAPSPRPRAPETIAVGIPSESLRRRPDVQAAEATLLAEAARVHQRAAERYPTFKLSGSFGWQDAVFSGLGSSSSIVRTLVASLAANLFDGGRIRSQIEAQDAVHEQALINYEQTVLAALEDVENVLSAYATGRQGVAHHEQAVEAARDAAQLARQMYQVGLTGFQEVLDTQRTLLSAEDDLATAYNDVLVSVVRLYKALGGGWETSASAPTTRAPQTDSSRISSRH